MSAEGLQQARDKMHAEGVDPVAIDVFSHYYGLVESGATGMIPEDTIDPVDMESIDDVEVRDDDATQALAATAVIKLNGGLGTSMGMDRAKSLLEAREGLTFLDLLVRQVLHARKAHSVRLPLIFMNSFRTSAETMAVLARYPELEVDGLPLEFLQNKEPKLRADDLTPVTWEPDPSLEWCPPGHGDIYTALLGTGLLDRLIDAGYERVFVSNSDNLGAVPSARVAGWFARFGGPFAIEAVRRTPSDRKGGHFARRKSDGRLVLRETAQTPDEDTAALADLDRHRFCSTNNLWFDLAAMKQKLSETQGVLGLAMIRNEKTVDPADPSSPEVIQVETAMGAAIEVFEGASLVEVGRDRFAPVKTTNDLLVLRSDCYCIAEDQQVVTTEGVASLPFVDLDAHYYKLVGEFDRRFPEGAPSMREATSLVVHGDWTFGRDVRVVGDAVVEDDGAPGRIEAGTVLGEG